MNQKLWVACTLIIAVVSAGCVPSGPTTDVTFYGNVAESGGDFQMTGNLASEGGSPDQEAWDDVTVTLLTENQSVICRSELGDLETDYGSIDVNITSETLPEYVVFRSPDFWTDRMTVSFFERTEEGYPRRIAESQDELPGTEASGSAPQCEMRG